MAAFSAAIPCVILRDGNKTRKQRSHGDSHPMRTLFFMHDVSILCHDPAAEKNVPDGEIPIEDDNIGPFSRGEASHRRIQPD